MPTQQKVKKQHFFPQKSLRRFANESGGIWVFDKASGRSFKNPIDKTACQNYFYDLKTIDHDRSAPEKFQIAEQAFCEVESIGQPVIDMVCREAESFLAGKSQKILSDKMIYMNDRIALALFLAVQYLRTPDQREHVTNLVRLTHKVEANLALERAGANSSEEFDFDVQLSRECAVGEHVLLTLKVGEKAAPGLARHLWLFSISNERCLVTCDTPVILLPHESNPLISGEGLLAPGIEIVWNLSPRVTLSLADRQFFSGLQKVDGRCVRLSLESVDFLNALQLRNSRQYLHSHNDDFDWARKLLDSNPTWQEPVKRIIESTGPLTHGTSQLFDDSRKADYVLFRGRPEHADEIK